MADDNILEGRSKRVKSDKKGKLAAFERLKALKGTKNKYEIVNEVPVYEELSEKEYSKLVKDRQANDWIVDDDGCGYVEDGREIFDDEDEDESMCVGKKQADSSKKKYLPPEKKGTKKVADIKSMFKAQPAKRKNEAANLDDDDDLLGSIMNDVQSSTPLSYTPKPMILQKKPKKSIGTPVVSNSSSHVSYQRQSLNPFGKKPPRVNPVELQPIPKKIIQPKVVDFDNFEDVDEPEAIADMNGNGLDDDMYDADNILSDTETKVNQNTNMDMMEIDDMDFSNMSNECLNSAGQTTESTQPEKEESQFIDPSADLFESSFQGNFITNFANTVQRAPVTDIIVDPGHLPLTTLKNGDSVLRFFWLDAFDDSFKQPGTVYLFGKVLLKDSKSHVSCCVIVKDIERRIYVLPRETKMNIATKQDTGKPVTMQDVYSEVNTVLQKMKIGQFKSKPSVKNYAFDNPDIPDKCEYLEVRYSAKYPAFPADLCGSTFSHVLGTDTTSLEMLLLEQKLKGPGWLDIKFPQVSSPPVSWCKFEAVIGEMKNITPTVETVPCPPVTVLSLSLKTVIQPKSQQNEIVSISCLTHNEFPLDKAAPQPHYNSHFCALSKPSDSIFPFDFRKSLADCKNMKIECLESERALLAFFLAKLHKTDPDVIIGHDILSFDLDVLLHRISFHKIPNWSRIGRLKRAGMPRLNSSHGSAEKNAVCGRLLCDVKLSSKELLRLRSYDLPELASNILVCKYADMPSENIRNFYNSSSSLMQLVNHAMTTSDLILRVCCELQILPLALQITNIAGCVLSRTLLGGRSERNEFLLLHAFNEKSYICPSKAQLKKSLKVSNNDGEDTQAPSEGKQGRRKPAYEGGLVLEPKKGFYDKFILLMDFNSLYPSIIQEYNICFTTIDRVPIDTKSGDGDAVPNLPESDSEPGILPTEIRKLVESRRQVKQLLKKSDLPKDRYVQYDIRQRALKLTANSMYGCLGFTHSRFYAKPLAALITRKGREILMKTKELVEKMGLDVIYGDTDSIMINTNQTDIDSVNQLGNKVKSEINKLYRLLEIDIDGVYKPMLLLKKKKYAALAVNRLPNGQIVTKAEMKGLDIVRRDWSELAKNAGEYVIKQILSSKSKEDILESIHSHLITLGEEIQAGSRPLSDFVIIKQLTKNPDDYPDKKNQPHVLVALRMNEKTNKKIKQHDTVSYVICVDGSSLPPTQRAYHPDEVKNSDSLKIDNEYYLANQLHPVISRLCAPIEGTDAGMIAKLIGLNPEKYVSAITRDEEETYEDKLLTASSVLDDEDRFKNCDSLTFACPGELCMQEIVIDAVFKADVTSPVLQLSICPKCKVNLKEHRTDLSNQLQFIMRKYITKYYQHILICEDVGCAYQTRKMPLIFTSSGPVCPSCSRANLRQQYTEAQLYTQLAFFSFMFDIDKAKKKHENGTTWSGYEQLYLCLKVAVDKMLRASSYGEVNLSALFQGLYKRSV